MTERRFNFTKAAIEGLIAEPRRVFYHDDRIRGLSLLVEPTGRRTFYFFKRSGRKTYQEKIGTYPDLSIEQARTKALEMASAAAQGEDPTEATRRRGKEKTFGELFTWWMDTYSKARRKTHKQDQAMFDRYLKGWDKVPLSRITKAEARRLHSQLGQNSGQRTANQVMEMVRAVFNQAIRYDEFDGANPILGVEMFKMESRERRLLPGEVARFLAAVEACPHEIIRDYVYISLFTGQRQGNVLAMRWDQVDFEHQLWTIPMTKNGRPLVVPLLDAEMEILKRRRATVKGPWVFPSPRVSATGHMMEPKKSWDKILKAAKVKDFRIHDLRRSLGSFMVDTGANLPLIGKALGHKSQAATSVYARLSMDPVREAKDKAIAAMRGGKS